MTEFWDLWAVGRGRLGAYESLEDAEEAGIAPALEHEHDRGNIGEWQT